MFDYLIIGGGITGVTLARLLQLKKKGRFVIVEANDEPGGLCRTRKVGGHYLDIGGGHFLCSKFKEVYDFIFSHISERNFNLYDRVSKIEMLGLNIDYPLESNLWQLPLGLQKKYLFSIQKAVRSKDIKRPQNYDEWIYKNLGKDIADDYMVPYNTKIWGVRPSRLDVSWLHKVPRLNLNDIMQSFRERDLLKEKIPSHVRFYYPKRGGFQEIFNSIYKHVENKTITGQPVRKIRFENGSWIINDHWRAKKVINTAPWPALYDALGRPEKLKKHFKKLMANSVVISLWEKKYEHDWHWSYHPDLKQEYHRKFYIHNFNPRSQENGMYTETNIKRWPGRGGKWSLGARPLFEYINEVAYPIPVIGSDPAIKAILSHYHRRNFFGLGRWGQWQYFNADVCILEAMRLAASL